MSTPSFEARVVRGAGLRDELEIVYDGTNPPTALFDDLRAIGWVPPVLAPPPASAIDWSRPDPRTGARYTLRPYEAVGRAVAGSDAQDITVLQRVVARHAAPDPASAPAPASPAVPRASAVPEPPRAAAPAARAPGSPSANGDTREREVQVGATVSEDRAPAVRDELARQGIAVRSTRMSFATPGGFRGATSGQLEIAVRLQFRVPMSRIDHIVSILGPEATDVVVRR